MRKILSFFAFAAIMISFAACGGNNAPEIKDFTFNVDVISTRAQVTVTPSNPNKYYYTSFRDVNEITAEEPLRYWVEKELADYTFEDWIDDEEFLTGQNKQNIDFYDSNTNFYFCACYVEKGEDGYPKIVGEIATQEFTTYLANTLKPVFSESMHFCSKNLMNWVYVYEYGQWSFFCRSTSQSIHTKDLYSWSEFKNMTSGKYFAPSTAEWLRIFRSREHAEELFTLASITNISYHPNLHVGKTVNGLIILPDNWKAPQGVTLKSAKQIGLVWNEAEQKYKASSASFDGYAQNILDEKTDWWALEKAGAVFLPAAGTSDANANVYGWYWANSDLDKPRAICFGKDNLNLKYLSTNVVPASGYNSVRRVRDVE